MEGEPSKTENAVEPLDAALPQAVKPLESDVPVQRWKAFSDFRWERQHLNKDKEFVATFEEYSAVLGSALSAQNKLNQFKRAILDHPGAPVVRLTSSFEQATSIFLGTDGNLVVD